jgi:hypothetical protein
MPCLEHENRAVEDYLQVDLSSSLDALPFIEHLLLVHRVRGWVEHERGDIRGLTFYLPDNE